MVIVLLIFLVLLSYSVFSLYKKRSEALTKAHAAEAELNRVKEKQAQIDSSLDKLSTPEGIEDAIRDKFQVVKDGEELIVVTDPNHKETSEKEEIKQTFWDRIKEFFGA
jgi:cell division protein FtsB